MSFPAQTFSTIQQLIDYINEFIIPNGVGEIDGSEHNNVENGLANFIVTYTLNSGLLRIINGAGTVTLPAPMVVFSGVPTAVRWNDNVQNEYYVVNATNFAIPIAGGFSYVDAFGTAQTSFPGRQSVHMAKAINGQWIQVNNPSGSGGSLPPQGGKQGKVLFSSGSTSFWSDPVLQINPNDPNWVNGSTWVNGSSVDNPDFSSPNFVLFWNDLSRFLLQTLSPPEWQLVDNGFQILIPGWDVHAFNATLFLFFKGVNP